MTKLQGGRERREGTDGDRTFGGAGQLWEWLRSNGQACLTQSSEAGVSSLEGGDIQHLFCAMVGSRYLRQALSLPCEVCVVVGRETMS